MPDFLGENLADPAWFPPETAEQQTAVANYFGPRGPAQAEKMRNQLTQVLETLNGKFTKYAIMGYCWGAKIAVLSSFSGSPFNVAIQVHPSGLDAEDAPKITIPMCMLASKDEDNEIVQKFDDLLDVPKLVDTYPSAPHGWMTSRTDLNSPKMLEDYKRGYTAVLNFLHCYL